MTEQTFQKKEVHDKENSIYALWVGYKYQWNFEGKNVSSMTYYFRYVNDGYYDGNKTEENRIMKLISERLTIEYLEINNPMTHAILYRNKNRGRTLEGVDNPEIFRIYCDSDGFIKSEPKVKTASLSRVEVNGWQSILKILTEYSRANRDLILQHHG